MTSFDLPAHLRRLEDDGFAVIPDFLDDATLAEVRRVLGFHLDSHGGRNDFEGTRAERIHTHPPASHQARAAGARLPA